jgi:polyhydroxyalkanoate synthesis regulator protein
MVNQFRSPGVRLLKKYPNRRIYDTETSKFVTLAEIRQMVIDRIPIKIVHSKTLLTNRILEELIRFYGDKVMAMLGPYLEQHILQSIATQDQLREQFSKAFSQPYPSPEQAIKDMVEQYQALIGQTANQATKKLDRPRLDDSAERCPAVHYQGGSGSVGSLIGSKIQNARHHVFRLPRPSCRQA